MATVRLMATPSDSHLSWAASVIDPAATVVHAEGLHDGQSPWRLDIHHGDRTDRVVLRVADWDRVWGPAIVTAAAGLRIAARYDLPTARLIASDLDGRITGDPSLVESYCPGSSAPPDRKAMYSAGAALAALHTIALAATPNLPVRRHHTPPDDHPGDRRWAHRYRSASETGRVSILDEFCEKHAWLNRDRALDRLVNTPTSALLQEADDRISRHAPPAGDTAFLHGDVWIGNMLWRNDQCLGLIDWKSAGVGHPGVDLGSLRMQAALSYDADAPDAVTAGWEDTIDSTADAIAYWDVIAALYTPTYVSALPAPPTFSANEISAAEVTERRDAFLCDALERLDRT